MPNDNISMRNISLRAAVIGIHECAQKHGVSVYVVGGAVRDLLLGEAPDDPDLDVVVDGDGRAMARELAAKWQSEIKLHDKFLTAKLLGPFNVTTVAGSVGSETLSEIDITTSRTEIYSVPGALPTVKPAPIEDDLGRRDFSINSMALTLTDFELILLDGRREEGLKRILDPFNGQGALKSRTIKVLHARSFIDDPTRLFRAVRYRVRLAGSLDPECDTRFRDAIEGGALKTISHARVFNEVRAALNEVDPGAAIGEYQARGLFSHCQVLAHGAAGQEQLAALHRLSTLAEPHDVKCQLGWGIILRSLEERGAVELIKQTPLSKRERKEFMGLR